MEPDPELLFEVLTPLGFRVRVTRERWNLITSAKHPVMAGRDTIVKTTLESPEQVRQSRADPRVLLFYQSPRHDSLDVCGCEAGCGSRLPDHGVSD